MVLLRDTGNIIHYRLHKTIDCYSYLTTQLLSTLH